MLIQLPEEKKALIFPLFKSRQPNTSALWCYFDGIMPGKTFVDDIDAPTKAICQLDMSWVYVSDDADLPWIEETLREIIKTAWIQVVWTPERGSKFPLADLGTVIPPHEYATRKPIGQKPREVEIKPYDSELYEKVPWKGFHERVYGSKENFLKIAFGFYAIENAEICSESEMAFTARGYTEVGIITDDDKQRKGFAFAVCVKTLEEVEKRGLKPIWSCDVENIASMKLSEKLGFINPVKYNFIFFPQSNETVDIRKKIKD
ncbi:MAG: GNAT family N-acetyltransferase [Treponema sp.]|nr:GNAT family N-acetyltransferase [Treponema sp.]